MIAATMIGVLVLLLAYFVLRCQNLQREANKHRNLARASDAQGRYAMQTLVAASSELEKIFQSRLEAARKKGVMASFEADILTFLLSHVQHVVLHCCEKRCTVKEALQKGLAKSNGLTLKDLSDYIAKQPSDIRVAWSRNTPDGFLNACQRLSLHKLNVQAADAELADVS